MKNLIFIWLIVAAKSTIAQQTGLTESYPFQKLGHNPALASLDQKLHAVVLGQYGDLNETENLKNYYLAMEVPILKSMGLAVQYSDYSYNYTYLKNLSLSISKHIKLGENTTFSYGFTGGQVNTTIDYENNNTLTVVKEADKNSSAIISKTPINSAGQYSENQYLLGAGVFLNANQWHIGIAIPNIIKNQIPLVIDPNTQVVLERPAYFSLEKDFKLSDKLKLTSGGLYRFTKNPYQKGLDIQSSVMLNEKYSLGLWYQRIGAEQIKNQNKPLLVVAEIIIKKARLAYSVNLINNSSSYSNIKQQIMLRLDIDYLKKKQKI
ncbi:MAG: type IX secretion system membrane protein PorP/SprF [Bacteroidota bacterium]